MGKHHTIEIERFRHGQKKSVTPGTEVGKATHKLLQTFQGAPLPPEAYDTGASWAGVRLRHIGTNEATCYLSDKWGGKPRRSFEEFKHVSEAPQELYAVGGVVPGSKGPLWSPGLNDAIMPTELAELGPLICFESRLHVGLEKTRDGEEGVLGEGDEGCARIVAAGCLLYAGFMRSKTQPDEGETILVAIHRREGVQFVVMGDRLSVTKDGITG
jgi:hypothetical protein